jgi:Tfp pilus assembly protein PilF
VKKNYSLPLLIALLFAACATYQPPPPSIYIGNLPQSIVAELSLDERIATEEAWENLKQGKGNKARKALSKLDEQSPFYYVGQGYAYYILSNFSLAEDFFKAARRFSPDMAIIHLGMAQIYQKTGQDDLAFAEFREVLKREPEHPWVKPQYESLKRRKTEETLNRGQTLLAAGNTEGSKAAFLKALYYSPQSTAAHTALADIFLNQDQLENAMVHLEAANKNEPQNMDILKKYGEALFRANENKKALEVYEQLVEKESDSQEFRQRLEILKNRLGIFELPTQYKTIISSEAVSKEEVAALLAVKFQNVLDEPSKKPPIIIDIATSWASEFIIKMTSLGLLDIYPNHTFRPKKIITRAEMAEILLRLVEHLIAKGYRFMQMIPPDQIHISDVSADNYYYQPILQIVSYDIMGLYLDKTFKPDLSVSGQEAIKLLDIILGLIQ